MIRNNWIVAIEFIAETWSEIYVTRVPASPFTPYTRNDSLVILPHLAALLFLFDPFRSPLQPPLSFIRAPRRALLFLARGSAPRTSLPLFIKTNYE